MSFSFSCSSTMPVGAARSVSAAIRRSTSSRCSLRRLVRAQEEGEDPDERGAEALRDGQRPVGPDQVGVEVVLDIDLAER